MRRVALASLIFFRAVCRAFLLSTIISSLLVGLSNAGEPSAFQKAIAANNEREYLAALASLRYYKNISVTDVEGLRSVWESDRGDYKSSAISKLILAENLYRFDAARRAEYLPFLISGTQSDDEYLRAEAYFMLGFLRVEEMLPVLLVAVERADFKEALNSGYGLTSYERSDVYESLCLALSLRTKQDDAAAKVSDYLWSRREWRCEKKNREESPPV